MRVLAYILIAILMFELPTDPIGGAPGPMSSVMEYIEGDMVVQPAQQVTIENRTIALNGSLMVMGTLVLKNSSIIVQWAADRSVVVQGTLVLEDMDEDLKTPDGSYLGISRSHLPVECTGLIKCTYSTLDRLYIYGGQVIVASSVITNQSILSSGTYDVSGSVLSADIEEPDPASTITGCDIVGHIEMSGYLGARYEYSGLKVHGAPDHAFALGQGHLTVRDSEIFDVKYGISLGSETVLDLHRVNVRSGQENVHYYGSGGAPPSLNLVQCLFEDGTVDIGGGTAVVYGCDFNDSLVTNVLGGNITSSTFRNSMVALSNLVSVNVSRNHVIDCMLGLSNVSKGRVYHNGFIRVDIPYYSVGPTVECYYNREGNFYSSYTGRDDGSGNRQAEDGIGDTQIPYLERDYFPLMYDHFWLMPGLPDVDLDYYPGEGNVTVRVLSGAGERFIIQDSSSEDFRDHLRSFSTRYKTIILPDFANGTHFIRAKAYNSNGSRGWGPVQEVDVNQWPLPPDIIEVSLPSEGEMISITWRYAGEDVTKVIFSYREEGGSYAMEKEVFYPSTGTTIDGLKNKVRYLIEAYTRDHEGLKSRRSTFVEAVPTDLDPPGPPRDIRGEVIDNTTLAVRWTPPEKQDISEYQVLRGDHIEGPFTVVGTVAEGLRYVDEGLSDNTTYFYGVVAVDDDGPLSPMGGPIQLRTDHVNNAPVFVGKAMYFERIEGDPPLRIELARQFNDPDGDKMEIEVSEASPFVAYIDHDTLVVAPEEEQNGEGHVQLMVDDGEDRVYFSLSIEVLSVPDPPRIIEIEEPMNNSVWMPGMPVHLAAAVIDPDLPDDVLSVTWSSDIDGTLSNNQAGIFQTEAYLSPGVHRVTLTVTDQNNWSDSRSVRIVISLWGYKEPPWNFTAEIGRSFVSPSGFYFLSVLQNDGGLMLTFRCTLRLTGEGLDEEYERVMVLNGGTDGTVVFQGRLASRAGADCVLHYTVRAETMNGTFAGTRNGTYAFVVKEIGGGSSGLELVLQAVSLGALFLIVLVGTYVMVRVRKNNKSRRGFNRENR